MAVKFVARKQWVLAGTGYGFVHVYHCDCVTQPQKVTSFKDDRMYGLAVHPTRPYVFSLPALKIRNWNMGWKCTFDLGSFSLQVVFNPEDENSFASASYGHSVMV